MKLANALVRQPISFQPGTVVRNRGSGNVYTVIANYGDRAVAVRECSIMNPSEWGIVSTPNTDLRRGPPSPPKDGSP